MTAEPQPDDPLFEQISAAIAKVKPSLASFPLRLDTRFDSLGLSSLERAIVVFELEDAYDLSLVEASRDTFETVGEARDLIASMLEEKAREAGAG